MEVTDTEIKAYITKALVKDNTVTFDISLLGYSKDSDGYCSNIAFATFLANTKEGTSEQIEVAVKISRNDLKADNYKFEREVYMYKIVLPKMIKIQVDNNIKTVFDYFPPCYKIISNDKVEVIVMENLTKSGYVMYDCMKPLDLDHLKLVLREFGKFHAITFAWRDKRKEDFEKFGATFDSVLQGSCTGRFMKSVKQGMHRVCDILKEMNETELYDMCHNIYQKGADNAMVEIVKSEEPQSAILHGDCWNNNILFKYEPEDNGLPSKVSFIDWQFSSLHSPILDLSYFIYTTCSEQELARFDDLLRVYHTSFSNCLMEFECDPEVLFSYSDLQRHWKKYSLYGVLIVTTLLHIPLCERANNLNISESQDGQDWQEKIADVKKKNETDYRNRLVAVLRHFVNYSFR